MNPSGNLLISIDEDGRAILSSFPRQLPFHHFSLKSSITAIAFSPSGGYIALALGKLVQVWLTPSTLNNDSEEGLEFAPFVLHREYTGHHNNVTHIEWSGDSRFFLSAAKDLTARVWSLNPEQGFVATTLAGHRDSLLGAWFTKNQEAV